MIVTSKKLALAAVLALGTFTATGCAVEEEPVEASSSQSQALDARTGGTGGTSLGYTCTDSGFCQCKGLEDCNDMFNVCKTLTYCNMDWQGYRCSCLNRSLSAGSRETSPVRPGGDLTVK